MTIVIDTTVVIAVITNEPHKTVLVDKTRGATLVAPASLPWEIGNAFSAMFKQRRIDLPAATSDLTLIGRFHFNLSICHLWMRYDWPRT